ncbi:MAG: bifunctional phosphoribosylaminoimidazolecarboxamide formyltransferase/IMP cyclohydrolase [Bacteroidota bacterium]|nr:bifunctional phosphoribosylaminoimidazolecarboxamide formyltransferase/IMP cyclohydrolase [Bacteroidota bacterium]
MYDKTGIVDFAKHLLKFDIEIISTGGTYKILKENRIEVKSVEEVTGFPEVLGGRVKTLHPLIFAGILCDRENTIHAEELTRHNILPFDMIVVNLYPFEKTIENNSVNVSEAVEQIDIGGVSLIKAAAKNFKDVCILTNTNQYKEFAELLLSSENKIPKSYSQNLAQKAFALTSNYDNVIAKYFAELNHTTHQFENNTFNVSNTNSIVLRYGENPHQKAILAKDNFDNIYEVIHGKELSYNNLLDMDAAYNLISEFEFDNPACAIIKHGNPCGVAVSDDLLTSYQSAFSTDTLSPFGGIIISNRKIDFNTSVDIDKLFSEIILAPGFDVEALELLKKKKNRRLIKFNYSKDKAEFRKIAGGILYQDKNNYELNKDELKFVTDRKATDEEIEDMMFAFKVVKHTKSNAVVFVKDKRTLAIGGGQPSRIDSTKIAVTKAKEFNHDLKNSIAASDAFFPFADGLIEIAKAGASCIIQPGGSVRDNEIIKAADDYNLAMAFTGIRHFKH